MTYTLMVSMHRHTESGAIVAEWSDGTVDVSRSGGGGVFTGPDALLRAQKRVEDLCEVVK